AENSALAQALQVSRESLAALQRMQEQTALLHRQFLEGQELAHRTMHLLVEQQQRLLQSGLGLGSVGNSLPSLPVATPLPRLDTATLTPPPVAIRPTPSDTHRAPVACAPGRSPTVAPQPACQTDNTERVQRTLLEVIAEKTGYPVEMLDVDMAL